MSDNDRFKQRAIITGATGFIGCALCNELLERGWEVTAVVRPSSPKVSKLPKGVCVTELALDRLSVLAGDYDVFYHLAWNGSGGNDRNDFDIQQSNLTYTAEAVRAAKRCGCRRFIGAGSQAEYGVVHGVCTEETTPHPFMMYGAAKLSAYYMGKLVAKQEGISFVWPRIYSVYGVGQNAGTLISYVIDTLKSGGVPELSPCENMWDFLYITDCAAALRLLGEHEKAEGVYNVSYGEPHLLRWFVEKVRDVVAPEGKLNFGAKMADAERTFWLEPDVAKIKEIGFEAKVGFEKGNLFNRLDIKGALIEMDFTVDNKVIEYIKSFKNTIVWGCSFLGIPVGKYLKDNKINISCYWDKRADELGVVNGINVVHPLICDDKENTLIIICIGNNNLRSELAKKLSAERFANVMSDAHLHSLYKVALNGQYDYKGNDNPKNMTLSERMEKAIDYAIQTNYKTWNRQFEYVEYLRITDNICIVGDEDFSKFCKKYHEENNGINNIKFFCNMNSKSNSEIVDGMLCVSFDELEKIDSPTVILQSYDIELSNRLADIKINHYYFGDLILNVFTPHYSKEWLIDKKQAVLDAFNLLEDDSSKEIYVEILCNRIAPHLATKTFNKLATEGEYFSHGIFQLSDNECFVDAGAYIGDSIDSFMAAVNQKFDRIYSFELDKGIFEKLVKNVSKYDMTKINLYNLGVYNENKNISYAGSGEGMYISDGTDNIAEVVRLDDALSRKKITLIKMDVEGSDMAALEGASEIISLQKPKIAVSVYHKLSDLWEIPIYLKTLNKEYKVYIRHHSEYVWDTDCYAY